MKNFFSGAARLLLAGSVVVGFVCTNLSQTAVANEAPTKISKQMEDAVIRALFATKVASPESLTPDPSDPSLPSPSTSDLVPVVDALGFTESDLQNGGNVKTRLNYITALLAEVNDRLIKLYTYVEQINLERKRDANFFVTRANALAAQLQELKALTMTTEVMNQEYLNQDPLTAEELRDEIQRRTDETFDALPKLTPSPLLYSCSCGEGSPEGSFEPPQKICQCCGLESCLCALQKPNPEVPPTEEDGLDPDDDNIDGLPEEDEEIMKLNDMNLFEEEEEDCGTL